MRKPTTTWVLLHTDIKCPHPNLAFIAARKACRTSLSHTLIQIKCCTCTQNAQTLRLGVCCMTCAAMRICHDCHIPHAVRSHLPHSLRQHDPFTGLDDSQFEQLLPGVQHHNLKPGEMLFSQNDAAPSFFLLTRGAVMLYRLSAEGQEKIMRLIGPGQTFAESVMFMDNPRYPVHARATQASQLVEIDAGAYLETMASSFTACKNVFARLTERIQSHWDEIEVLSLQNCRFRIVHYVLSLAQSINRDEVTVTLPARKAQIASHLAVTPETLSRVLRALSQDNLIDMRGYQLHIPSIDALRRQLGD